MYYLQVSTLVLINCLLAMGIYLPLSAGRMVMCMGTLMSAGAIASAMGHSSFGIPFPLALLIGGLVAAILGAFIAALCERLVGFLFAVATLGLGELARVIVVNVEWLGGALGYRDVILISPPVYFTTLLFTFAGSVVLLSLFERSAGRRALAVLRENDTLAASLGINGFTHRFGALVAGAFLSGIAGGFYIHTVGILDPRMFGFESSLLILMFAIFGGTRNYLGAVAGAIILTVLPELFRFSPTYRMILYGLTLVLVAVLRPEGVLSAFPSKLINRFRWRKKELIA